MTQCKINIGTIEKVQQFVALANACKFEVDLVSGRYVVDAKSIMGVFSLDLTKALQLSVHADADEAADFLDSIKDYVVL